ncbi:MAG: hypothetical protein ACOZNI_30875 [Myxococcota bacterium]
MILALFACAEQETVPLHFDGPVAAAVLAEDDGPFGEPTGYVASSRSGTIVPLALKQGRLLTDDDTASFLRAAALVTGRARLLSDVAVTGTGDTVTVWAADTSTRRLLEVPYVTGVEDGVPVEVTPEAGDVVFLDVDGSGDDPTLSDVTVRAGFTTTEAWTVAYDGTRWWAEGSRSGTQVSEPRPGEPWQSDNGELAFTLAGSATEGDRFELTTDTGIVEHDLGGYVLGVAARGDVVYASVHATPPALVALQGGAEIARVALPDGAQPTRISVAPDGRVFVADGANPAAYVITDLAEVRAIATAGPLVDLAWQGGEDVWMEPFDHLFVAPHGALRVDVYDLAADAWVDPNPVTPEVEGVWLGSPVTGLAASVDTVRLQKATDWGALPRVPTVAVATADGYLFQLEGPTGCAVMDERGPHAPNPLYDSGASYASLEDQGATSDVELWIDGTTGEQIVASSCGGVTQSETWTVTFDSATLSWEVEGSRSGVQQNAAVEDARYLSDDGAVSFLVSPGAQPATDGDRFTFSMDNGLLVLAGVDDDQDGVVDVAWELPGRPVAFQYTTGPTGGGWDGVDRREFVLLPVTNGDIVARVRLDSGETDVYWE